jgi:hypothetical protein
MMFKGKLNLLFMALMSAVFMHSGAFAEQVPQPKIDRIMNELRELRDKVRTMEERDDVIGKIAEKVELHGAVEIEGSWVDTDFDDPTVRDTTESDLALATAALGVDIDFHEWVKGHVLFLWEEDDTEPVDLDEGALVIGATEDFPFFLMGGKFYVPFGMFNSHFVSDPLTLELGETRESSVAVGYANEIFELKIGAFNGDVKDRTDDRINSFVACANVTVPEGMLGEVEAGFGVSYISNIADSDNLQDQVAIDPIDDLAGGLGLWATASYRMFTLELEYIGATSDFKPGELAFDGGRKSEPKAWNVELAVSPIERLEIAARYGATDDIRGGDFLAERQYGGVASYEIFNGVSVALEYMNNHFENKDDQHMVTAQLAAEF